MVWENVPGAFSSNKGEDFRAVLEETIRIAEPDAPDVPLPQKGRWPLADAWIGDGWSVAYRVFDAQFWRVPQRRRRIALVADYGGHAAPEILVVRKSVQRDFDEGGAPGETATGGTGGGAEKSSVICLNDQGGSIMGTSVNVAGTLRTQEHGHQPIIFSAGFDPEMGAKARGIACEQEKAPTLTAQKIAAVLECEQPAAVQPEPLVMATARTKAEILTGTSPTILSGNERLMRCTFYRGLTRVSNWVRLKFAAMNLKKLASWKARKRSSRSHLHNCLYPSISLRPVWIFSKQAAFRQAGGPSAIRRGARFLMRFAGFFAAVPSGFPRGRRTACSSPRRASSDRGPWCPRRSGRS